MYVSCLELPIDVWRSILSFLPKKDLFAFEGANRKTRWLVDASHWSTIHSLELVSYLKRQWGLNVTDANLFDLAAGALIRRVGRYLLHLDVSRFASLEYGLRIELESAILENCRHLNSFVAGSRLISEEWLYEFADKCGGSLKRLTFTDIHVRNLGAITSEQMNFVLLKMPNLENLICRYNRFVKFNFQETFSVKLRVLDLEGCKITTRDLQELSHRCPELQSLSVSCGHLLRWDRVLFDQMEILTLDGAAATGTIDLSIFVACPNLISLSISANLVTKPVLLELVDRLPRLGRLSIPGAFPGLSDEDGDCCARNFGHLHNLTFLSLHSNTLMAIAVLEHLNELKALETLDLSYALKFFSSSHHRIVSNDGDDESGEFEWLNDLRSDSLRQLLLRGCAPPRCVINRQARSEYANMVFKTLKLKCPRLETVYT